MAKFSRSNIAAGAVVGACILAVAGISVAQVMKPVIPIDVAQLEREFDHDADAAMARYSGKRVQVTGKVASIHQDRITFASIYILNVQAHFTFAPSGLAEGRPATILCNDIGRTDYPTGAKPELRGCSA